MRLGQSYLKDLHDDRCVVVDGERLRHVPDHAAFRGISRTIAGLYDYAADPSHGMTHDDGTNRIYGIPRSREDLRARREAITAWATLTNGLVGRGPEHVAGFLAGFAGAPDVFARADPRFAQNVTRFHRAAAEQDLFVTYVIVPP